MAKHNGKPARKPEEKAKGKLFIVLYPVFFIIGLPALNFFLIDPAIRRIIERAAGL